MALHFEGLNTRYDALQKKVHKAFLIKGSSPMPTSINKTILMASHHRMERGLDPSTPIKTQTGVVCIQHGTLEEHAGENEELKAIVMAQGEEEKKKVVRTSSGDRVVCFNPKFKGKDDNHFLHHCLRADAKERKAIMKTTQAKWAEEKQAKKTVVGQVRMQATEQDIAQQV